MPIGAFAASEEVADAMVAGDHGTTYGGNPLATAAACKVFEIFDREHIVEHVQEVAPYLRQKLESLAREHDCIREVLISAGSNIIRFVPPLIIEKCHIDTMCDILGEILP